MAAEIVIPAPEQGHLRRLDMRRDLAKVADLVELCFYDSLDPEGKQYLKDMRRAAQNASLFGWASGMIEEVPMPPSGYVWEEDGRLVGNLSLIPIHVEGKHGYMIANVATHPDYRGHGIARALTVTALGYAHSRNAACVWLQVRDDNPSAIHIYETSGFAERLRRTSWYSGPTSPEHQTPGGIKVGKRRSEDWQLQREWLKRIYPPELEWHIPWSWNKFQPSLMGRFYRLLSFEFPQHWSVEYIGELKGVLTWEHSNGYTDPLWLAIPNEVDVEATICLFVEARKKIGVGRPLSLNYPAGLGEDALRQAGFHAHQTLIWMVKNF